MSERLIRLAERIRSGLVDLNRLVERAREGLRRARLEDDDLYLDSVALNLHGFYAGLERLFELTAANVDGAIPQGANWHQILLQQMAAEIPGVRPAMISERLRDSLDEYRGFCHVYTFSFDPLKMRKLVEQAPAVVAQLRRELLAFAEFLEDRAQTDTKS